MEVIDYSMLFPWWVGMNLDKPVGDVTVFCEEPLPPMGRRCGCCTEPEAQRRHAFDEPTTRRSGFAISQVKRKRIEACFVCLKTIALMRKVRHRGIEEWGWVIHRFVAQRSTWCACGKLITTARLCLMGHRSSPRNGQCDAKDALRGIWPLRRRFKTLSPSIRREITLRISAEIGVFRKLPRAFRKVLQYPSG